MAIGLSIGAAGFVGVGMFGAATVVGVVRGRTDDFELSEPAPKPLLAGTVQASLVNTLQDCRVNLELLPQARHPEAVAVMAAQATEAARTAETVSRALDAIDDAVTRASPSAGSRPGRPANGWLNAGAGIGPAHDAAARDLLSGLTTAVDEVGEIYATLLELAAATDLLGMHTDEISEATQVSQSLDAVRGVFADLAALDLAIRSGRPPDRT
jgi:hypothetical protein